MVFAVAACVPAALPAAESAPTAFSASYRVEARGITAGASTQTLSREPDGSWRFHVETRPKGLGRLVASGTSRQVSRFRLEGSRVLPRSFELDDGFEDRKGSIRFDHRKGVAVSIHDGDRRDLSIPQGVQDMSSAQIALMFAAAEREPRRLDFPVLTKNELRHYRFARTGEADVHVEAGRFRTLVYEQRVDGKDRVTRLWLAPAIGYVPVKMVQFRGDKKHLVLELESVERPAPVEARPTDR